MSKKCVYGCFLCCHCYLPLQDESLFGPPARLQQMTGNRGWNEPAAGGWWAGGGSSSLNTAESKSKGENFTVQTSNSLISSQLM